MSEPIIRKPVWGSVIKFDENTMIDQTDHIEENECLDTDTLNKILTAEPSKYDRIDLHDASIVDIIDENTKKERRFLLSLWGDAQNPTPENSLMISCEVLESVETVQKSLFGKDITQDVITLKPVSIICGSQFNGLMTYQMDCCPVHSYFLAINIGNTLHTVNRDPIAGIQNQQNRILEGLARPATKDDLELIEKMMDHALNPHHDCASHGQFLPASAGHQHPHMK